MLGNETEGHKSLNCESINDLPVPVIEISGLPKARGLQYGEAARELICNSVRINKEIICSLRGQDIDTIIQIALQYCKAIKLYDIDAFEEMQGIAEGAGLPFEDILILNLKPELMNPYCQSNLGCTTVAIKTGSEYIAGQSFDWFKLCKDLNVFVHIKNGGYEGIMVTEAGCIGGIGINNSGIAVLLNYLNNYYIQSDGVSYNCLLRRALLSNDMVELQRNLLRSPIAFGLNILSASRDGVCIDYELTSKGSDFFIIDDRAKCFIHTNHYLSEKLRTRIINRNILMESKARFAAAQKYLAEQKYLADQNYLADQKHQADFLEACFMQHDVGASICRHDEDTGVETLYSVVFDMNNSRMHFKFGLPCVGNEYRISYKSMFSKINF